MRPLELLLVQLAQLTCSALQVQDSVLHVSLDLTYQQVQLRVWRAQTTRGLPQGVQCAQPTLGTLRWHRT